MAEFKNNLIMARCIEWGSVEEEGIVLQRDIFFYRPDLDRIYGISVSTPAFLRRIQLENEQILDPDERRDEGLYVIENISNPDEICSHLQKSPLERLKPFIYEQIEDPNSTYSYLRRS